VLRSTRLSKIMTLPQPGVATQPNPLEARPTHAVGHQHTHEAKFQPAALGETQASPCVQFIQRGGKFFDKRVDKRQWLAKNGGSPKHSNMGKSQLYFLPDCKG
jgi:hypothetical protein